MEEEVQSVIINIPKPRIYAKKSIESFKNVNLKIKKRPNRTLFTKPSETSIRKYYLPCDKPLPAKILKRADVLLSYRQYIVRQGRDQHKHRLAVGINEKYKITCTDLRQRLFIDDQPNDVFCVKDIDEGFFKYVDGRPMHIRIPLNKSLKVIFDDYIRLRQEIGYRYDYILNVDISLLKEQKTYELAAKSVATQAKCFNSFISDDYAKSMMLLDEWEKLRRKVEEKNVELQNLAVKIFRNSSRLICLDYRYNLLQRYGRFLYYLSPPSWRTQNRDFARSVEIEAKGFDYGDYCDADSFTVILDKMQKDCSSDTITPVIYFKEPVDLNTVFESIEKQQLNHFVHVTLTSPYAQMLKKGIKHFKDLIAQDTAIVADFIEGFKNLVDFYQERSDQLEAKFFKILYGIFYESVATPEVLKFRLHLEFCYERIFTESPLRMDLYSMGKELEYYYFDYRKRLDNLQEKSVGSAVKECLEADKIKHRKMEEAIRELRLFDRLKQELLIAFAPPAERVKADPGTPRPSKIQTRKISRRFKSEQKKISLTEAELEYLVLFTDWIENEDPMLYLQSHQTSDAYK